MKRGGPLKRSALKPGKPLARGAAIARTTRIKAKGRKAPQRFAAAYHSTAYVEWIHSLGCSVPPCARTDIEAAHVVRPRSRGGKWWEVAPLCTPHHRMQEKRTAAFNAEHGIDLESIASAVALRWRQFAEAAAA